MTEKQQFQLIFYNDTPKRYIEPGSQMPLLLGQPSSIAAAGVTSMPWLRWGHRASGRFANGTAHGA